MIPFGDNIRKLRNSRSWTQALLAQKLGVSKSLVAHYEMAERFPSLDVLIRTARVFGVSTDFLLGVKDCITVIDVTGLSTENVQTVVSVVDALRNK